MRVIKDQKVVEDDWVLLDDDTSTIPSAGDIIISLDRWNKERHLYQRRSGQCGVLLDSNQRPENIEELDTLRLIAINFPKFTDGRGYSLARLLRSRLGYRGELRAVGNVLRDQLLYMRRCGFDSFALQAGKDAEGALEAFQEFGVTYQAAEDEPRPLFRRAQRARA